MITEYNETVGIFENLSFDNLSIPNKIYKINEIIKNFPDERKHDICESCRHKIGDLKQYNAFIQDGGICSSCLKGTEVLNYSILELIEKSKVSFDDYYNYTEITKKENVINSITYNGLRKYWNYHLLMEIKKEKEIQESINRRECIINEYYIGEGKYFTNKKTNFNWFQNVINILFIRL